MILFSNRTVAGWSGAIFIFSVSSLIIHGSPSVESLNEQMERLERLLGIPSVPTQNSNEFAPVIPRQIPGPPIAPSTTTPDLPESLVGIEKKLAKFLEHRLWSLYPESHCC